MKQNKRRTERYSGRDKVKAQGKRLGKTKGYALYQLNINKTIIALYLLYVLCNNPNTLNNYEGLEHGKV